MKKKSLGGLCLLLVPVVLTAGKGSAAVDITPPVVTINSGYLTSVDVSCGDVLVEISWTAQDELSGIRHSSLIARPQGPIGGYSEVEKKKKVSGDALTWNMLGYIRFKGTSAPGPWSISGNNTADTAMNFTNISNSGLIQVVNNSVCTEAPPPTVTLKKGKSLSAEEVSTGGRFPVLASAKISMSISKKSTPVCSLKKGKLKGLKRGVCTVKVTKKTPASSFAATIKVQVTK
jgi:hypothetical protein